MDDLPLVERIVRTCAEGLDVPVTVKIRIFPELQKTIAYAQMLERAGASLIAVHGRLREQKKSKGADADWEVIKVPICTARTFPAPAAIPCAPAFSQPRVQICTDMYHFDNAVHHSLACGSAFDMHWHDCPLPRGVCLGCRR